MMSFYYLKFQKEIPKKMLFSTQKGGNLIQLDYDSFPYNTIFRYFVKRFLNTMRVINLLLNTT